MVRDSGDFLSDFPSPVATGSLSCGSLLHATGLPTTACVQPGGFANSRFSALTVAEDWENKGFVGLDTWYFGGDRPGRRQLLGEGRGSPEGGV